jgi:hypothetical protein
MNNKKHLQRKRSSSSSSSSLSMDNDKKRKKRSKEKVKKTTVRIKSNPCIDRVINSIPSKSSFTDNNNIEFSEEDDCSYFEKRKNNKPIVTTNMGLNIAEDYFVIDKIKNRDIPREDGYERDFYDNQHWDEQPFGKAYYEDQLKRVQIMNENNVYTFIKLIAGGMSKSPYELFDEEDMDRVQQEKEAYRMEMKSELKRRIVSSDQKINQLKSLTTLLEQVRKDQLENNERLELINEENYQQIDQMLKDGIDIFSNLCYLFEVDNGFGNDNAHYSYTNILDLFYLLDFDKISRDDKIVFIEEISDSGDSDEASPLLFLSKKFNKKMNNDDFNELYMFIIYFIYYGQDTGFAQFIHLSFNTLLQFLKPNDVFKALKIDKLPTITPCIPLVSEKDILPILKPLTHLEIAINGCILTMSKEKSELLIKFMDGSLGSKGETYNLYSFSPPQLVKILKNLFGDETGRDKDRRIITQRYFIYKWFEKVDWNTIKSFLNDGWKNTVKSTVGVLLEKIKDMKEVYEAKINEKGDELKRLMQDVLPISPFLNNVNIDDFNNRYRGYKFEKNLLDKKFKKSIIRDMNSKNPNSYEHNFAVTPIHQWLYLYLQYHEFIRIQDDFFVEQIIELENAIDESRRIVIDISNEKGSRNKRGVNREDSFSNPEYRQKKSFTSKPSISGIVKLKDEIVMFINKGYNLVQQYCVQLYDVPLKEFHSDNAIKSGLTCSFANFIALLIADNHIIFPDQYKSKEHMKKITISKIEAMQRLKKYSYSQPYLGNNEYQFYFNASVAIPANRTLDPDLNRRRRHQKEQRVLMF